MLRSSMMYISGYPAAAFLINFKQFQLAPFCTCSFTLMWPCPLHIIRLDLDEMSHMLKITYETLLLRQLFKVKV